jgi:hypothetical protein
MKVIKPISSLPLFSYHFYAQILSSSNLPRTKSGYKNVYSVRVSCGIASAETRKVRVVLSPSLMGSRCPVHCASLGRSRCRRVLRENEPPRSSGRDALFGSFIGCNAAKIQRGT